MKFIKISYMKLCSKEGCERKHLAKGLCAKHYYETPEARERQKQHRSKPEVRLHMKEYLSVHYQKNKTYRNMQTKEWTLRNHERRLAIQKKYRDNNKDKSKVYYVSIKNKPEYKERMRQTHIRFVNDHPDYHKQWCKENPEKKLSYDIKRLKKLLPYYPHLKDSWDMAYALSNWANTVKKRDNHTCQNCGAKHRLHAHHILYPRTSYPTLVLDISNGVSFCRDCHEAYHQIFDGITNPNI